MQAGGDSHFLSAPHAAGAAPGEYDKATSYSDAARTTVRLPRRIFEAAAQAAGAAPGEDERDTSTCIDSPRPAPAV